MKENTRILFVDTNTFLQVRDLKDIPWNGLLADAKAIDLMIAPRVLEELDKHKSSTNKRRRDRARLALQLIEKASVAPDLAYVIKNDPLLIRVVISSAPRFDWSTHPTLDPGKPDDQLIAEALSFGKGAEIFSHDSGPRIRARVMGIAAFEPEPEWLLPPEQTDEQRKITKLERELEQALSRSPKIVAEFAHGEVDSEIHLVVPVLSPIDASLQQVLSERYFRQHPRASLNPVNRLYTHFGGISESQIAQYQSDYSTFVKDIQCYWNTLHKSIECNGLACSLDYCVANDSGVSAKGLRIEFTLVGNGSLLASREDAQEVLGSVQLPQPPEKPQEIWELNPIMNIPRPPGPRDPVAFYWFKEPKLGAKHSALQCEDFRATRIFEDDILVIPIEPLPTRLEILLHLSAENLPAPKNIAAKLVISRQQIAWTDPVVRGILPDTVRELLDSVDLV